MLSSLPLTHKLTASRVYHAGSGNDALPRIPSTGYDCLGFMNPGLRQNSRLQRFRHRAPASFFLC